MGKLNSIEIAFNDHHGVYFAGQHMEGRCTVDLGEEMTVRGVRLRLEGKAYVHWTETHSSGSDRERRSRHVNYQSSEKYFEEELLLFGNPPGQRKATVKLAAGRTSFPFCFKLPPNLPSSFEGEYGHVRYSIKGIVDKPWAFDHTTTRPFTVIGVLDLNTDRSLAIPVERANHKMLCCLCCASGPITALFRLERRGYVPGEAIGLFADIINDSDSRMDMFYVQLRMITTFHSTTKSRICVKEVGRVMGVHVPAHESFSWQGRSFVVPQTPPSHLLGCRIIDIRYILQLNVVPSDLSFDLEVPLEIVIGTIPLHQFPPSAPQTLQPLPGLSGIATEGGQSDPGRDLESAEPYHPLINNPPSPSFGASVLGTTSIRDERDSQYTRGTLGYAPLYPHYGATSQTQSAGNRSETVL